MSEGSRFDVLSRQIDRLRDHARGYEALFQGELDSLHPGNAEGGRNLLHYLAVRQVDMRWLQNELADLGLSSLGRAESHVMATLDRLAAWLRMAQGGGRGGGLGISDEPGFRAGTALLASHASSLLGPAPARRDVRIMVTAPTAAATDPAFVRSLLTEGMDCMRINCAHDSPGEWLAMIENLRVACAELGRECRVMMDLAGPKLRTGPVAEGPRVARWRPRRDELGRVVRGVRILFRAREAAVGEDGPDAVHAVPPEWLTGLDPGKRIHLTDARGRRRDLDIEAAGDGYCIAVADRTVYVTAETVLRHGRGRQARTCVLADLPPTEMPIVLHDGDDLWLTREPLPGRPARQDADAPGGSAPARISCTLPEVLADARRGDAIWFDDGRIGGVVEAVQEEGLRVRIHSANGGGERLRADKGINLPDSDITLPAVTERDRRDLEFITRHADLVALSFVRTPDDLAEVQRALVRPGIRNLGIILKIETRRAFENLPGLLLASLRTRPVGVMIARGDLAVECGFERLAEVQEEILWLCEAAHVPAIWATQVLESMARTGRPSRAEITDAAMSERAECVLLNKGPHIASAIRALDDILRRMQDHQEKKRARLRPLTVSGNLAWRTRAPGPASHTSTA